MRRYVTRWTLIWPAILFFPVAMAGCIDDGPAVRDGKGVRTEQCKDRGGVKAVDSSITVCEDGTAWHSDGRPA